MLKCRHKNVITKNKFKIFLPFKSTEFKKNKKKLNSIDLFSFLYN